MDTLEPEPYAGRDGDSPRDDLRKKHALS